MEAVNALGRRKTSVARVYLTPGKGKIVVNKKDLKVYFPTAVLQNKVSFPLTVVDLAKKMDVNINVKGGGINGQAEAIQLGISRALVAISEDNKPNLKAERLLKRDPRMVERKKPGRRKARKKSQFSKR
ncbi:MAG: 30S ribosomal protein S9 [Flavobacteriales bacterium]|nr:30S ribosomal protein S9 [Flavobacteriales bacterium]